MSDSAFKSAPFSAYATAELQAAMTADILRTKTLPEGAYDKMAAEIARRAKVAAGDLSVMFPGERMRYYREADAAAAAAK